MGIKGVTGIMRTHFKIFSQVFNEQLKKKVLGVFISIFFYKNQDGVGHNFYIFSKGGLLKKKVLETLNYINNINFVYTRHLYVLNKDNITFVILKCFLYFFVKVLNKTFQKIK